jgi:stage II sporulation protein AB (anti-sigma F factor)
MQVFENEKIKNQVKLTILSDSANVGLARVIAAAFAAQADLTISEIDEIKVAVSEAVSNSIIHGYGETFGNYIELTMNLYEDVLEFIIADYGRGIENIEAARQPANSTTPERMGMGFVFMESFMDTLEIKSEPGQGTKVAISKKFKTKPEH